MKREPESREVWAKRVERWRESGLGCAEFSSEIGVNPKTLSFWDWRLRKDGTISPRELRPVEEPRDEKAMSKPMFMELVTVPAPANAEAIEIVVRTVTVRVPQTAAADLVRQAFDFAEKQK